MRLSFIIPCYNAAKTVRRCLDSIYALELTEEDFEVIAVNDASTDDTLWMIREYAEEHSNLVVLNHLVNRNLGAARNSGLVVARGASIAFIDSDDEVVPGLVNALKMMEERALDMVAMRLHRLREDGVVDGCMTLPYPSGEVFSGIRLQTEHSDWNWSQCINYLYSRTLLEKVAYPFVEGITYEDADFVCHHLLSAERMSYCDEYCYQYHLTPSSITHTQSPQNVFGYAFMGVRLLSLYEMVKEREIPFALSVKEKGSIIIKRAFFRLSRLESSSDVRLFYRLLDARVERNSLLKYHNPADCWTVWTRFGLKHRILTTAVIGVLAWARKSPTVRKIRHLLAI